MAEVLEVIFRDFWTFFGTCWLITISGWALSFPFFWWYRMKQLRMSKSYWELYGN